MKIKLFLVAIASIVFVSVNAQSVKMHNKETLIIKAKITGHIPVGWGHKYAADVEHVVFGDISMFGDTLFYGVVVSQDLDVTTVGDVVLLRFRNTHEENPFSYLPSMNATVDKKGIIWELIE